MVQKERTLTVDIPPGVEEGTRIRLSGEGQAGVNGGPLAISTSSFRSPSIRFSSATDTIFIAARTVAFITAALGGSIEVPTLDGGRSKVDDPGRHPVGPPIPHPRQGHAGPARRRQRGDLYIEVAVETPVRLSRRQKELLREFEGESKEGCQPEAEGFLAKLKEFWKGGQTA